MTNLSFGVKFLLGFLLVLLIANIFIFTSGSTYIYKALIYQQVGIDDINLFNIREVKAGIIKQEWSKSNDYNKNSLSDSLRKTLERNESVAFLVIKNDSIQHEEYWDNYKDTTLSNPFSVTKSVVSLLIGIAIEEGKIKSVDQLVGDFIPEFKEGKKAGTTIKNILQMASGLDFMESYSTPFNYTTEAYYGNDLVSMIKKLNVIEPPGTISRYKSGDTQILGLILIAATGKTLSEYASEKIWSKLGVQKSAQWSLDHENGIEKAYCCFYTNARDLAKIGKLILQNGNFNGDQLVDSAYLAASFTPTLLPDEEGKVTDYYGYQWWLINRNGVQIKYARGLGGQYLFIIPSENMIVVRLGNKRSETLTEEVPNDILTYLDEVIKEF